MLLNLLKPFSKGATWDGLFLLIISELMNLKFIVLSYDSDKQSQSRCRMFFLTVFYKCDVGIGPQKDLGKCSVPEFASSWIKKTVGGILLQYA